MFILKVLGWSLDAKKLDPIKKSIIIEAPHTSNWDFFLGILAASSINLKFKFIIKKEWNKPIIGNILLKLGAIFIDRSQKSGLTENIIEMLNKLDEGHIIFTPEGTRSRKSKWKSGFYHIAQKTKLPISIAYIDYKKKKLGIHKIFHPTGNIQSDCNLIRNIYKKITPKNKKNYDPNWKI